MSVPEPGVSPRGRRGESRLLMVLLGELRVPRLGPDHPAGSPESLFADKAVLLPRSPADARSASVHRWRGKCRSHAELQVRQVHPAPAPPSGTGSGLGHERTVRGPARRTVRTEPATCRPAHPAASWHRRSHPGAALHPSEVSWPVARRGAEHSQAMIGGKKGAGVGWSRLGRLGECRQGNPGQHQGQLGGPEAACPQHRTGG